jgi:hypothetical protein
MPQAQAKISIKDKIITEYAQWTVLSAVRQGCPIRSRKDVYPALCKLDFSSLFDESKGAILSDEFDAWHASALETLTKIPRMESHFGWAAKMVNVYLKTAAYISGAGRPGLSECIHPPFDDGLWKGLRAEFSSSNPAIVARSHAITKISGIQSLDSYNSMIDAMRELAKVHGCSLIELEQFWLKG